MSINVHTVISDQADEGEPIGRGPGGVLPVFVRPLTAVQGGLGLCFERLLGLQSAHVVEP